MADEISEQLAQAIEQMSNDVSETLNAFDKRLSALEQPDSSESSSASAPSSQQRAHVWAAWQADMTKQAQQVGRSAKHPLCASCKHGALKNYFSSLRAPTGGGTWALTCLALGETFPAEMDGHPSYCTAYEPTESETGPA